MLFFLASWFLLAVCGATLGSRLLGLTKSSIFSHFGDRMIVATWLGLLTGASILLGLSVVLPLSPAMGLGLLVILTTVAGSDKSVRIDLRTLLGHLTRVKLAFGFLIVVTALNATRLVEAYDTGLYHYPLTSWLARYGTVRGLALIHFRFGFSSSWFALAAPFDFGPFQGRTAGLLGGFAILLCLLHFAVAIARILQRRAESADWFLAGGYIFVLLVCLSWAFEVSLSPDVPVWILTFLVGWLMLVSGRADVHEAPRSTSGDGALVVLMLALCTIALKPSAAPIVVVAAVFYWFTSSSRWSTRLFSGAIASIVAVPVVLANLTSSGCPLYPNSAFCLDVPWGVGKPGAQEVAAGIADWGRWRDASAAGVPAGNWVVAWISQPEKLVLVSFCAVCLVGFFSLRGWRAGRSVLYTLGLALFGTAFVFVSAPNPRFGVGYFALYPAILLAAAGPKLEHLLPGRSSEARWFNRPATLAYLVVAIAGLVAAQGARREIKLRQEIARAGAPQMPAESELLTRLLLPPAIASSPGDLVVVKNRKLSRVGRFELATDRWNGIEYRSPQDRDQCWGAALPCVPAPLEGDVGLRSPAHGFQFGFAHLAKAGNISRR
jgi:hypothetical protein